MSGKFRPARKAERVSDCLEPLPGEIEMAVKMRPTCTWTKRPHGALLYLGIGKIFETVEHRRDSDVSRRSVEHLSFQMLTLILRPHKKPARRQCLVGSFAGEVASKIVTEAFKGWLIPDGNRDESANA